LELSEIITELQSLGVKLPQEGLHRKGGAGPAEAGSLIVGDIPINVPVSSPFVSRSSYALKSVSDGLRLLRGDEDLTSVRLVPKPRFYDEHTRDGVPYSKIALLHGMDCLASSVLQTCTYWHPEKRCRFCGIELSLKAQQTIPLKSPDQLAEVAAKAKALDSVGHVVLTTGMGEPPGSELSHLMAASTAIKTAGGLPIHAQFLPPLEKGAFSDTFQALKAAGVDTVGIHIESLDPEILEHMAPMKAAIGLKRFEAAWKAAVAVFGPNQVSSFLIAGLGEAPATLIQASEYMADMGVYPFVVPLRPIPGSLMSDACPPDPEVMKGVYEAVIKVLEAKGLSSAQSLAGCVRCGACSALAAYEYCRDSMVCHPARTPEDLDEAFKIRETVFVEEQHLFEGSDQDAYDNESIHLVAKQGAHVIGTVRVFPAGDGNGHWIGGRLAVKKGLRSSGAGELLVRHAVMCVKQQGCTHFTAHIQAENIPFFEQLGWRGIGPAKTYFGRPHQLMEADLGT